MEQNIKTRYEQLKESVLSIYEYRAKEDQKNGIIKNRYQYGIEMLNKLVFLRIQGAISNKEYKENRDVIEKELLFY